MADDQVPQYIPLYRPPAARTEPAMWFAFRKSEILVVNGSDKPDLPCCVELAEHGLAPKRSQYLGLYGGTHCYAAEIHDSLELPAGWSALGLRDLFGLVESTLAALSGRAYHASAVSFANISATWSMIFGSAIVSSQPLQ